MKLFRWIGAALVLLSGLAVLSWLQHRFDEADLKKGLQAVEAKFPVTECRAEVVSRWHGKVRVDCREGKWLVDVIQGIIGDNDENRKEN